jgi:hypothetical protein
MPRFTGQILRILGLLIEMLGILALVFRTGTDEAGVPLPGSFPPRLVWGAVAFGFVIWLVGTILNYWARSAPGSQPSHRNSDLDLNL